MQTGHDLLIDEISLADDSVLERLNSVLEEERTLMLAEYIGASTASSSASSALKAHPLFRLAATMNPGGDFGKKELSAALRNRFTEIWCPAPSHSTITSDSGAPDQAEMTDHGSNDDEFRIICQAKLLVGKQNNSEHGVDPHADFVRGACVDTIGAFLGWLIAQPFFAKKSSALSCGTVSVRDLMRWIMFINTFCESRDIADTCGVSRDAKEILKPMLALVHGACLVFIGEKLDFVRILPDTTDV